MADESRSLKLFKALAIASASEGPPKSREDHNETIDAVAKLVATIHLAGGGFPQEWTKPLAADLVDYLGNWTEGAAAESN